jgi:hypothetical protein
MLILAFMWRNQKNMTFKFKFQSLKFKGPYNKIIFHWDGQKIFIKLKNFTKVILN